MHPLILEPVRPKIACIYRYPADTHAQDRLAKADRSYLRGGLRLQAAAWTLGQTNAERSADKLPGHPASFPYDRYLPITGFPKTRTAAAL